MTGGEVTAPARPRRVVLTAYRCIAGQGSEAATGWGWAQALAEAGHDVTVLTRPLGRAENDAWLRAHPDVRLTMEYVDTGWFVGRARRSGGRRGRKLAYLTWQQIALRRAAALHARAPFDIAHHVSFGSLALGSPLWRLGCPFVFGPVGSAQRAPRAARPLFGGAWGAERLRSVGVALSPANPLARRTVGHAAVVLCANRETGELASALGARRVELMCDTGVHLDVHEGVRHQHGRGGAGSDAGRLRVIWLGSLAPWKGVALAVDAFARAAPHVDADLHIVGDGPLEGEVKRRVSELGLDDRVVMHGRVPWLDAQALLASADVMLFTSVRETFGSQVLEAAAAGLPLVAVDLHGVASLVPAGCAEKVPFSTLPGTAAGLAAALRAVLTDPDRRAAMAQAARRFAEQESWPSRALRTARIYREVSA